MNFKMRSFAVLVTVGLVAALLAGCAKEATVVTTPATPTPTPPANLFPASLGELKLFAGPMFGIGSSSRCECRSFDAVYKNEKVDASYHVESFNTADEARQRLQVAKYLEPNSEVIKQDDSQRVAINKKTGAVTSARLAGANLIVVSGRKDAVVVIENNLPYREIGIAAPPLRKIEEFKETPVTLVALQKDFEKDPAAAAKKYGTNFVLLAGKVEEYGDEVETTTVNNSTPTRYTTASKKSTSFRRLKYSRTNRRKVGDISNMFKSKPTPKPTAKTVEKHHPFVVINIPVAGGDPLGIMCDFDPQEFDKILALEPEQEILFRGEIKFVDGKLKIVNARVDSDYRVAK